jgi:hypothetical protein
MATCALEGKCWSLSLRRSPQPQQSTRERSLTPLGGGRMTQCRRRAGACPFRASCQVNNGACPVPSSPVPASAVLCCRRSCPVLSCSAAVGLSVPLLARIARVSPRSAHAYLPLCSEVRPEEGHGWHVSVPCGIAPRLFLVAVRRSPADRSGEGLVGRNGRRTRRGAGETTQQRTHGGARGRRRGALAHRAH